jgi:hypothetical protein
MIKYEITNQWLAGFIDGEGCFNISRTRNTIFPRLLIANTNIDILRSIKEKYGGDISSSRNGKNNWKTFNCYRASWRVFKSILQDVLPYLTIKKQTALVCLEILNTKDMSKREELRQIVKSMNKRGI